MRRLVLVAFWSAGIFLLPSLVTAATVRPINVESGLAGRRSILLHRELAKPFPDDNTPGYGNDSAAALGKLNYALAALTLHDNTAAIERANRDLSDLALILQSISQSETQHIRNGDAHPTPFDIFHFGIAQVLYWIISNYGVDGEIQRSLLDPNTERKLDQIFLQWGHTNCNWFGKMNERAWDIWGSENHDALSDSACWAAAGIEDQVKHHDGQPHSQEVWSEFLVKIWKQRLRHIAFVEYFSPTYSKYTLLNLYLYAQLSNNPELKSLATDVLDLWWAIWAQEQIDGIDGGSKARVYPKALGRESPMQTTAWLYFGVGKKPDGFNPGEALMVASSYSPPRVVTDLATDIEGRGSYEIISTAPGAVMGPSKNLITSVDPDARSIVRIAYIDPSFVMGLAMTPRDSYQNWAAFSSQNRWSGVLMAGGNPSDEVAADPEATNGRTAYNAYWGVQTKATQIIQFIAPPESQGARQLRIVFGPKFKIVEDHGWVVVDAKAFVAVRPAFGGYSWVGDQLLAPNIRDAPIIIQAAPRTSYRNLASFEQAIIHAPLTVNDDEVIFKGLLGADKITFFIKSGQPALLKGKPISFGQKSILQSPFIKLDDSHDRIVIRKDHEEKIIPLDP